MRPLSKFEGYLVVLVLGIHGALAGHAVLQHNPTVDEGAHVLSGFLAWRHGELTYYYVNPPLVKLLTAAPLVPAMLSVPELGHSSIWDVLDEFARSNASQYLGLIWRARFVLVGLSILGGWLIYRWSRQLFGVPAGLVALVLWTLCPNVLAWSGVATVDLGTTVIGLAAVYGLRHYLQQPGWLAAAWVGILLGLAQLSKFTLLVLYPVYLVICGVAWWQRRQTTGQPHTLASCLHFLLVVVVSVLVINMGYGFHGTSLALGSFAFKCDALTTKAKGVQVNRFQGTWLERLPTLLPAAYVMGLDEQKSHADAAFPAYLRGQWQETGGWWHYYLYGLGVKLPPGTLLLIGLAGALFICSAFYRANLIEELLLWLPAIAILLLVSAQTGINGHLRYALPLFPFLFIGVSRVGPLIGRFAAKRRLTTAAGAGVVMIALAWNAISVVRIHPHYLSYFNELAGGPDNGWKHLLGSNVDWGQDLLFLKRWVDEHPEARPLHLAYYGGMDPHLIGLDYRLARAGPEADAGSQLRLPETVGPLPGWHAISVNFVQGAGFRTYDEAGRALYSPPNAYQCFQKFTPVSKAGYSIFIYHVTADEARRVRQELGLPPLSSDRR